MLLKPYVEFFDGCICNFGSVGPAQIVVLAAYPLDDTKTQLNSIEYLVGIGFSQEPFDEFGPRISHIIAIATALCELKDAVFTSKYLDDFVVPSPDVIGEPIFGRIHVWLADRIAPYLNDLSTQSSRYLVVREDIVRLAELTLSALGIQIEDRHFVLSFLVAMKINGTQ